MRANTDGTDGCQSGVIALDCNLSRNALVVETRKGNDHFLLVYPDTPAGRLAAKQAVRVWLLDCELDFNRRDAEHVWRAIDARRLGGRLDRREEGGVPRSARRR